MLQAEKSHVRFLLRPLHFFSLLNNSSRTIALGFTQSLAELSTWYILRVKGGRCVGLKTSPQSVSR
jgi:hypothetical protein